MGNCKVIFDVLEFSVDVSICGDKTLLVFTTNEDGISPPEQAEHDEVQAEAEAKQWQNNYDRMVWANTALEDEKRDQADQLRIMRTLNTAMDERNVTLSAQVSRNNNVMEILRDNIDTKDGILEELREGLGQSFNALSRARMGRMISEHLDDYDYS